MGLHGFKTSLILLAVAWFAIGAPAQQPPANVPATRPPTLVSPGDDRPTNIVLEKVDIAVAIHGCIAQSTFTLTYRNISYGVLEGNLSFPLPDGATICGYALDVNGQLVDGVPVEKGRATAIFNAETAARVDPGLVEHVADNVFRTRVFPLPALGARTIRISYITPLADVPNAMRYELPLPWGRVPVCSIALNVSDAQETPIIKSLPIALPAGEQCTFARADGAWLWQHKMDNANLAGALMIDVSRGNRPTVVLQYHTPDIEPSPLELTRDQPPKPVSQPAAEYHFVIHDISPPASAAPKLPARNDPPHPPRIGVLWDASFTHHSDDIQREIALLEKIARRMGKGVIDLVVFRESPEHAVQYPVDNGVARGLSDALHTLAYDSGKQYANLDAPAATTGSASVNAIDYWLLFSDGRPTMGEAMLKAAQTPVYAFAGHDRHMAALQRIAAESGGLAFDLPGLSDEQVLAALGATPFRLMKVDLNPNEIADVFPPGAQPPQPGVILSGRLLAPRADIMLTYGVGKIMGQTTRITLRKADARPGRMAAQFWASQIAMDLSANPAQHRSQLTQIGRRYGIVTPTISLLVLETIGQYFQYRVLPPRSLPEMRRAFIAAGGVADMALSDQTGSGQRQANIRPDDRQLWAEVQNNWWSLAAWWNLAITLPKDPLTIYRPDPRQPWQPVFETPAEPFPKQERQPRDYYEHPIHRREPHFHVMSFGGSGGRSVGGLFGNNENSTPAPEPTPQEQAAATRAQRDEGLRRATEANLAGDRVILPKPASLTDYLRTLETAKPEDVYSIYLRFRPRFADADFYIASADALLNAKRWTEANRVIRSLAATHSCDPVGLRKAARHMLVQKQYSLAISLLQLAKDLCDDEPQSYLELALAYAQRAESAFPPERSESDIFNQWGITVRQTNICFPGEEPRPPREISACPWDDYQRALDLLWTVARRNWKSAAGLQIVALTEANRILVRAAECGIFDKIRNPLPRSLIRPMDLDLRVLLIGDYTGLHPRIVIHDTAEHERDKPYVSSRPRYRYPMAKTLVGSDDPNSGISPTHADDFLLLETSVRRVYENDYELAIEINEQLPAGTEFFVTVYTDYGRATEERTDRIVTPNPNFNRSTRLGDYHIGGHPAHAQRASYLPLHDRPNGQ